MKRGWLKVQDHATEFLVQRVLYEAIFVDVHLKVQEISHPSSEIEGLSFFELELNGTTRGIYTVKEMDKLFFTALPKEKFIITEVFL